MRRLTAVILAAAMAAAPMPAEAYLKLGARAGTRTVTLKWPRMPIRYFVTDRSVSGVTSLEFQQTITRAFATWAAVSSAQVSSEFVGFTSASPVQGDGATVLGFQNRPDMERTLGATSFLIDTTTGDIVESDIFFNSFFPWSVAAQGQTNVFDLESIAVHEIGVAFNPRTGKLIGGFSLSEDGAFVIAGLDPGPHAIRAEPLDDGDIESFFDLTLNIDINFRAQFHDKLVVVPRGGGASGLEIKVVPK
jgi:hypothetical protein